MQPSLNVANNLMFSFYCSSVALMSCDAILYAMKLLWFCKNFSVHYMMCVMIKLCLIIKRKIMLHEMQNLQTGPYLNDFMLYNMCIECKIRLCI